MKFVKLLGHAYVNGLLRSPADGVLHLEDDEAKRVIEAELAEDVTSDFSAADRKSVPVESLTTDTGTAAATKLDPVNPQIVPSIPLKPDDAAK